MDLLYNPYRKVSSCHASARLLWRNCSGKLVREPWALRKTLIGMPFWKQIHMTVRC